LSVVLQTECLVVDGLTVDHDLANKEERERVEKKGGVVEMIKGCYRVNKKLGVSRAFGDRRMKTPPVIDAEPAVSVRPLVETADALVAATDGLWQYLEPRQVFKKVKNMAEESCLGITVYQMDGRGTQLVEHDNILVCVVKFVHGKLPPAVIDRLIHQQTVE
jgi:serine/threonine protein phosphatase PrpC